MYMKHFRLQHNPALTEAEASELMERFFDGETTRTEEHLLSRYLRSGEASPEMRRYASLIGWLDDGMPSGYLRERRRRLSQIWTFACSTAAMLAVVVTLGIGYSRATGTEYSQYEGSFVVRNGQRITDIRAIMPQIHRAEALAVASSAASTAFGDVPMDEDMRRAASEMLDY